MKILLFLTLLGMLPMQTFAQDETKGEPVDLVVKKPGTLDFQRTTVWIPTVTIDGDTIYFYDDFEEDVTISIVESDPVTNEESLVYSTALSSEQSEIELPQFLSGSYIIYVEVGSTLYYGYIEVE